MIFDCHTHILPGMDDGAETLETSLAMLKMAEEHGTTRVVVTPHVIEGNWFHSWEKIVSECKMLCEAAREKGLKIVVFPGAELALHLDLLKHLPGPGAYCYNGGRYLLVELPSMEIPSYTDDFFFTLLTRGIVPVLAHPERHQEIIKHPGILAEWVGKGVMVQLNAPSLLGRMGEKVKATAEMLIKARLAHCIGSDAHGLEYRRPIMSEAAARLERLAGKEMAEWILETTPQRMLNNMEITVPEPQMDFADFRSKKSEKSGWLTRLFR